MLYLVEALAADHLSAHLAPRPSAEQAEPGLHTEEAQLQQRDKLLVSESHQVSGIYFCSGNQNHNPNSWHRIIRFSRHSSLQPVNQRQVCSGSEWNYCYLC